MGSGKFAAYAFLSTVVGFSVQLAFLMTVSSRRLAPGPYLVIFSLLVQYFAHVPKLVPRYFSLAGVNFSDKTFNYIIAGQLLFSHGVESVASGLAGMIVGMVISSDIMSIASWRIPGFVATVFAKFVLPWFGSEAPWLRHQRRVEAEQQRRANTQNALNQFEAMHNGGATAAVGSPAANDRANVAPPGNLDELVAQLTGMGFEPEQARAALASSGYNVGNAVEILLSGRG